MHVSHKFKATQVLCALKPCARKCHIPSNQCRYSNYSLPEGIMEEEDEEGSSGGSIVALGQHLTAGRYRINKRTSAFLT